MNTDPKVFKHESSSCRAAGQWCVATKDVRASDTCVASVVVMRVAMMHRNEGLQVLCVAHI